MTVTMPPYFQPASSDMRTSSHAQNTPVTKQQRINDLEARVSAARRLHYGATPWAMLDRLKKRAK